MGNVYLQQKLQGKFLEWDVADDMSGWVAWLPDGVKTEKLNFNGEYEYVDGVKTEYQVHKTSDGRRWIKTNHDGNGC